MEDTAAIADANAHSNGPTAAAPPVANETTIAAHPAGGPHARPSGFVKHTLGATTIILAWLYVVGWAYLHAYFAYFGINISTLDLSVYNYFTAVFIQLVSGGSHGILLSCMVLSLFALIWFGDRVSHTLSGLAIGIAVLILFWAGFQLTRVNAREAAQRDIAPKTTTLPTVSIEYTNPHSFVDGDIDDILSSAYLRLLWETKDTMYVFVPVNMNQDRVVVRVVGVDRANVLASIRSERIK